MPQSNSNSLNLCTTSLYSEVKQHIQNLQFSHDFLIIASGKTKEKAHYRLKEQGKIILKHLLINAEKSPTITIALNLWPQPLIHLREHWKESLDSVKTATRTINKILGCRWGSLRVTDLRADEDLCSKFYQAIVPWWRDAEKFDES